MTADKARLQNRKVDRFVMVRPTMCFCCRQRQLPLEHLDADADVVENTARSSRWTANQRCLGIHAQRRS